MRLTGGAAWRALGGLVALLLALVAQVVAADPVESLSVAPEAAVLDRFDDDAVLVRLIARLAAGAELPAGAALSVTAPPGIAVERVSGPEGSGDAVWTYRLTAAPEAHDDAAVEFRLGYAGPGADKGGPPTFLVKRATLSTTVRPPRDASLAEAATLAFESHDRPLRRGAPVRGALVVTNASESPLTVEALGVLGPAFVEIDMPEAPGVLPPRASHRLPVTLRLREGAVASPGAWLVQLEALIARGSGMARREGRVGVDRMVEVGAPTSAAEGVTVELKAGGATLFEGAPLDAHLLIANAGALPVTVTAVTLAGPAFVDLSTMLEAPAAVAPGATLRLPVTVSVADGGRVRIGTWPIYADVSLSRAAGEVVETGTLTASADIEATVPGVSDVLKLLEVPTILLLPGVLVLLTWAALVAAPGGAGNWLEFKSKTFWLLAVLLSILIFFGWRQLSDVDFTVAYSLADVATMWIACILGAVAIYAFYLGGTALLAAYRARLQPREEDSPLRLLEKLHARERPFYLPTIERRVGGRTVTLYLTGDADGGGRCWAIPAMVARPHAPGGAANAALQEIDLANNEPDKLAELLRLLKTHRAVVALDWSAGPVPGPVALPDDELGETGSARSPLLVSAS